MEFRTGWARSPQGVEYLVNMPPQHIQEAARVLTGDQRIDAAIFWITKRKIHSLMTLYSRKRPYGEPCSDRIWAIYREAQALVEHTRGWRDR